MDDRFNTIAGWTLFAGIVALGLSSLSGHYFLADKDHRPEKMGYVIEGVEAEGGEGAAAAEPIAARLAKGDVAKGEATFAKCKACHSVAQGGANGIGPNLWAIVGAGQAAHGGFAYSDALKGKGGKWDFASLDEWLTSPAKYATGTKMSFAGIGDAQQRADVILYLNSQGSNQPLPAAEAAAPAAEAPAADASAAASEAAE
jgi:cytochrome c